MSAEETLMNVRKEKHQELNSGTYPLPAKYIELYTKPNVSFILGLFDMSNFNVKTSISADDFTDVVSYNIHGRISAIRKSGSITFIKLTDVSGSIQLIASKAVVDNYHGLKLFDLGDIVEVYGWPCLSKTGEKSMLLTSIKLMTKSLRTPPEKFVGITDDELKVRKRHLDLMSSEESRARFIIRSELIKCIRNFMDMRLFLEVETSTLNAIASGANAKPFTTHHNALNTELSLRIAPELSLKRLLVGGLDRVYEIGKAYRNEGIDSRHNPEFTIMESYQAYARFENLISFTKKLISNIDSFLLMHLKPNNKGFYVDWLSGREFNLTSFVEVSMLKAVMNACDKSGISFSPRNILLTQELELVITDIANPRLSKIDMKGLLEELENCDSDGQKIGIMFEYIAEPFLTEDYRTEDGKYSKSVFITEYPIELCPLARVSDTNPLVCDRFELFIDGRELANGFQELNDPQEQALRFKEQLESNNKDPMAYDADYVEALEYGMPPAIGLGVGIDRLVMLLTGTNSIKDVILFPTLKPKE